MSTPLRARVSAASGHSIRAVPPTLLPTTQHGRLGGVGACVTVLRWPVRQAVALGADLLYRRRAKALVRRSDRWVDDILGEDAIRRIDRKLQFELRQTPQVARRRGAVAHDIVAWLPGSSSTSLQG